MKSILRLRYIESSDLLGSQPIELNMSPPADYEMFRNTEMLMVF